MTQSDYAKRHKEAFRAAFDYLNAHFPPGMDSEWWEQAVKDASVVSDECGGNSLVNHMLISLLNYLEDEWRIRDGQTDD